MKDQLLFLYNISPRCFSQKLKSANYNDLFLWFLTQSIHLSHVSNIKLRAKIFLFNLDLEKPPTCLNCGKTVSTRNKDYKWSEHCSTKCKSTYNSLSSRNKARATSILNWGTDNPSKCVIIKNKIKQTNITRHGVEYPLQSKSIQAKRESTLIERLGVSHALQSPSVQARIKKTNLANYGVENVMQSKYFKDKLKDSNMANYGVDCVLQLPIIRSKIKQTNLKKYGVEFAVQKDMSNELLLKLENRQWVESELSTKSVYQFCKDLGITYANIYKRFAKLGIVGPYITESRITSVFESEVAAFLTECNVSYTQQNRDLIAPLELDFILPDYKIAIECNGSYWHSELNGKDRNYHLNKTELCLNNGLHLIHIWEHDWNYRNTLIKNRLKAKLGICEVTYARKTTVKSVSSDNSIAFLNTHHIQGHATASVRLGLYYNDQLCALMTFGKSRFKKDVEWELIRYCSNGTVVGGASKLFKRFCADYSPTTVISYSDRMWNTGKLYKAIGFSYSHTTLPCQWITKDYHIFGHRIGYQKHKLIKILETFNADKTAWQNLVENKYDRIWDCGNDVWVFKNTSLQNLKFKVQLPKQ